MIQHPISLSDSTIKQALEAISLRVPRRLITRPELQDPSRRIDYLFRAYPEGKEAPDDQPGILLHKFVSSDEKERLHSHPWKWAYSFILDGTYLEHRSKQDSNKTTIPGYVTFGERQERVFKPGDINLLTDQDYHRVEIISSEVWTLFLHGPRCQEWAFADEKYGEASPLQMISARTFKVLGEVGTAKIE